jgi:hypothetical protein
VTGVSFNGPVAASSIGTGGGSSAIGINVNSNSKQRVWGGWASHVVRDV